VDIKNSQHQNLSGHFNEKNKRFALFFFLKRETKNGKYLSFELQHCVYNACIFMGFLKDFNSRVTEFSK
jgi:hypothetical protein